MRASSKKKKLLLIISIVISCIIIAVCVIHLPLLIYNIKHENNVCINNFTDTIAIRSELSTADILTKCRYRSAMTNLDDIGKFAGDINILRETPKGYYAVIQTSDDQFMYFFFHYTLVLKNYLLVQNTFIKREQAQSQILKVNWNPETDRLSTSLPYQRLNTGAEYIAYYYQDGIDVVRYSIEENGIKIPNKEEYLCSAVTIQSLSYSDLFLSPRCWFSPLNDLTVILKKDLS